MNRRKVKQIMYSKEWSKYFYIILACAALLLIVTHKDQL